MKDNDYWPELSSLVSLLKAAGAFINPPHHKKPKNVAAARRLLTQAQEMAQELEKRAKSQGEEARVKQREQLIANGAAKYFGVSVH